jgi:hypothetical protein
MNFGPFNREFCQIVKVNLHNPELLALARSGGPLAVSQFFETVAYSFDPRRAVATFAEVRARKYAACAEAAAAIAAADIMTGGNPILCLKSDDLTNSAHAVTVTELGELDPYAGFYFPGVECGNLQRILQLCALLDTEQRRPGQSSEKSYGGRLNFSGGGTRCCPTC